MEYKISQGHADQLRMLIAVAAECCRPYNPSYSWHVVDWISDGLRQRYPIFLRKDSVMNMGPMT